MLADTWTSGGGTPHSPCSDHGGRRGWWKVVPLWGSGVVILVSLKKSWRLKLLGGVEGGAGKAVDGS